MKKELHNWVYPEEYSRIPHMVYLCDFNTSYPSSSRIDRIASEIDCYLNYKLKNTEMYKG